MTDKTTEAKNSLFVAILFASLLFLAYWATDNPQVSTILVEHPGLILFYLIDKFGYAKLFFGSILIIIILCLLIRYRVESVVRGSKLISARKLKGILKSERKPKNQPQLRIAGMPIPAKLENRGFLMVGSPGSGKTQAISQMTAVLKQRSDFRGIIFDRGGEMLEKFYDPAQDLIFNPFDIRSVDWNHTEEPTRPETLAAGLINESSKEPFFSNAGRALLAEFFRKTQSNSELWQLLSSDFKTLSSFVSGSLASRYLGEEKMATSILSTISNYCQFYPSLLNSQNKPLSFYRWAQSNSSRWIFLTLHEDDTELLKPLYSLIFELALKGLLSNEKRTKKTAIIIDELGALNLAA